MRPKLYTRKKKIRGGNTLVTSRPENFDPRLYNTVNNDFDNVKVVAAQMKAENAAIQTAATNASDNVKVVAVLDPNAAQMRAENAAKLKASKLKGQIAAKLRAEKAVAAKTVMSDTNVAKSVMPDTNVAKTEAIVATDTAEPKEVTEESVGKIKSDETLTDKEKEEQLLKQQEEERANKIEGFKQQLIKLQEKMNNPKIQTQLAAIYNDTMEDEELDKLSKEEMEAIEDYIKLRKDYNEILQKITALENETNEGFINIFVIDPLKKIFGKIFDGFKDGTATAITSTGKFWTDTFALSIEKMEPSLKRIQDAKDRIYKSPPPKTEAGEEGAEAEEAEGAAEVEVALNKQGGGRRYPNINEVQKGGAAAAKRAQNSIKQFLSSSVTSSQILSMVKQKTKAKRTRDGKRYSRKRAKK